MLGIGAYINLLPVIISPPENWAQHMGSHIGQTVPRESIIESWEWEVDVLSQHWEFHHPSHSELIEVTRQIFIDDEDPQISYNVLQADPDYLLRGPMSDWIGIYDDQTVDREFTLLESYGPYKLFQRNSK